MGAGVQSVTSSIASNQQLMGRMSDWYFVLSMLVAYKSVAICSFCLTILFWFFSFFFVFSPRKLQQARTFVDYLRKSDSKPTTPIELQCGACVCVSMLCR